MTFDGRIVEYLENGKFICGFVLAENTSRLHLLNQNSRELTLPQNRIVHFTNDRIAPPPARDDIIALLKKAAKYRAELAGTICLDEIWEIVAEKQQGSFNVGFLAALYFGDNPTDDQTAAFLRSVIGNRLYFKYRSGAIHVHSLETVAQIKNKLEKEKEQEQFIARNTEALQRLWQEGEPPENWDEREVTLRSLADYYLFGKETPASELAARLVKNAELTGPHDIFHLLVKAGVWDKNENIPLLRQGIPLEFSAAALAEVDRIQSPTPAEPEDPTRKDFRHLPVLTIDGPGTKDFDDGLHIERQGDNYLVGIHIADVGLYVKPGTALFAAALERGTSIYFPDKHLPMLPPTLSEGKLSLIKNLPRHALSFLVLLSPAAEVIKFEIVNSVVAVQQQLTYHEADHLIEQDRDLAALAALSVHLRQRRVNRGALLLPLPDLNISIRADDSIEVSRSAVDTPSRVLVAEFMILANILGAQFVAEREAPGLFRCQPEPRQRLIDGFENDILKIIQQRKRLAPMSLLTSPKNHSCVGAPQYTTVTSPLRRLLDLIMQLQIKHLVRGKGIFFSKKDMKHFGAIIMATLEKANQVKYLRQRYWILKYLQNHKSRRFPAIVINRGPRRVHIFLEELLLDGDLPINSAFKVDSGDIILVRVAKVDPLGNTLRLEW
ncbi:MAG: ribonuclease catalytic domain-containing protein [Desulfobulbales bacterium]